MKKFRRLLLWLGLVFIVLLAFFSVYGAFLGAEKAQQFFNSMPLAVYWTVFAVLISGSIFSFPRLIKSPGLFAMHAGCVLIITGSMWGSYAGHEMQRKYFGSERIQSSMISIVEGYVEDKLFLDGGSPVNQSLNSIEIADFSIEYDYSTQSINFISHGQMFRTVPVVLEEKISLGVEDSYIVPLRFFNNLGLKTVEGEEEAFEKSDGGSNPALEIKLMDRAGDESTRLLADTSFYNLPFLIRLNDFRIEYYKDPSLVVVDENGLVWSGPAEIGKTIELGPEYGTITPTKIFDNLINDNGQMKDREGPAKNPAVEMLVDFPGQPQEKVYSRENFPDTCIVASKYSIRTNRTISDYISELEIVNEAGDVLASKDIEVNKPLHYGGYHFYQSSYQQAGPDRYATVLSVTSDSGLYCVFAGFFAMCCGILYHQWLRPILKKKEQKPEAQAQG
ncbi:MAG: cytochrome c biogenesis protein ResB [Phycisphaerae bacterium]|nr:cytochrome c biogenesis protein ResB [Phycisphaerae bacterium]